MTTFDDIYSWVQAQPIIDWHNHLDLAWIAADRPLGSLYDVWVRADPYKHRLMRICGESERVITGAATEAENWAAWMRTLPKTVGTPVFAWAQMELKFLGLDVDAYLHGAGENVSLAHWSPRRMLAAFRAEYYDPGYRMNAGERPDFDAMTTVHERGGHVLDVSADDVARLALSGEGGERLFAAVRFAAERGWTLLLHLGALRETSARLRAAAGAAGGYAAMRAPVDPAPVAAFLNACEGEGILPRTILLTLNPEAHAQLAVLAGSFTGEGEPGKVQLGPAWWWCDHREGIVDVLEKNAAYGALSTFVGMTTDSRSLLSFVRHDYFRKVFARWLAAKVASGEFPDDPTLLQPLAENVCYRNAKAMVSNCKG